LRHLHTGVAQPRLDWRIQRRGTKSRHQRRSYPADCQGVGQADDPAEYSGVCDQTHVWRTGHYRIGWQFRPQPPPHRRDHVPIQIPRPTEGARGFVEVMVRISVQCYLAFNDYGFVQVGK
jgi:hypothetical protein